MYPRACARMQLVTVGVDCHKYQHYYCVTAWALNGDGQVIDYGVVDTHAKQLGEERGIDNGLERVYDLTSNGWVFDGGGMMQLTAAGVDSGGPAWNRIVYSYCKRHPRFVPTKGEGISRLRVTATIRSRAARKCGHQRLETNTMGTLEVPARDKPLAVQHRPLQNVDSHAATNAGR